MVNFKVKSVTRPLLLKRLFIRKRIKFTHSSPPIYQKDCIPSEKNYESPAGSEKDELVNPKELKGKMLGS